MHLERARRARSSFMSKTSLRILVLLLLPGLVMDPSIGYAFYVNPKSARGTGAAFSLLREQALASMSIWERLPEWTLPRSLKIQWTQEIMTGTRLHHPVRLINPVPSGDVVFAAVEWRPQAPEFHFSVRLSLEGLPESRYSRLHQYLSSALENVLKNWREEGLAPEDIQNVLQYVSQRGLRFSAHQPFVAGHQDGQIDLHLNFVRTDEDLPDLQENDGQIFQIFVNDVFLHEFRHLLIYLQRKSLLDPPFAHFAGLAQAVGSLPLSAEEEEDAVLAYQEAYYFDYPGEAGILLKFLGFTPARLIGSLAVPSAFFERLDRAVKGLEIPAGLNPAVVTSQTYQESVLRALEQMWSSRHWPHAIRRLRRILPYLSAENRERAVAALLKIVPEGKTGYFADELHTLLMELQVNNNIPLGEKQVLSGMVRRSLTDSDALLLAEAQMHLLAFHPAAVKKIMRMIVRYLRSAAYVPFGMSLRLSRWIPRLMSDRTTRPQLIQGVVRAVIRCAWPDREIFSNLLPFARAFLASPFKINSLESKIGAAVIEWMMKSAIYLSPVPADWNTQMAPLLKSVSAGRRRKIKGLYERLHAAYSRHAQGALIPESVKDLYDQLPTAGSRQAGLIACYLYTHGRLDEEQLRSELGQLVDWERHARERFGPDFLVAQEFHSSSAAWDFESHLIQKMLELMMRVTDNVNTRGQLQVSTLFEDGGLEFQSLPTASGEVQARLWDLWEAVGEFEGVDVYGASDDVLPEAYWLHWNVNGELPGDQAGQILLWWARENARLAREVNFPLDVGGSHQYIHWGVRPPRRSRLGGVRTELIGTLWIGPGHGPHHARVRAYRQHLLLQLAEISWAYQNRRKNPEAARIWEDRTRDLPSISRLSPFAKLIAAQIFFGLHASRRGPELVYTPQTWTLYNRLLRWVSEVLNDRAMGEEEKEPHMQRGDAYGRREQYAFRRLYEYLLAYEQMDRIPLRMRDVTRLNPFSLMTGAFAKIWLPVLRKSIRWEMSGRSESDRPVSSRRASRAA
jgi:hypothetical protein